MFSGLSHEIDEIEKWNGCCSQEILMEESCKNPSVLTGFLPFYDSLCEVNKLLLQRLMLKTSGYGQ